MKLKKCIMLLLVLSMIFSLAGCKGSGKESNTKEAVETNQTGDASADADGYYVSDKDGGKTTDQFTIWAGWTSESPNTTTVQKVMKE